MVSTVRKQKISDRIREELSEILLMNTADPRLAGISVTEVRVDREVTYAEVFISALEGAERQREILQGLEHAQGYLRRELAQRIDLRSFPRLRFHWDKTIERADRIERLLHQLRESELPAAPADEPQGEGEA
jgi:ribosome-binding factor A